MTATNRLTNHGRQGSTGGNSVLPQLAVTCNIEAEYSYQTFVQGDSEVLRNRQLRQHANRCVSALDENTKNETNDIKVMNTKILTLILSLTTMLTFAQTSEHLSFKGVPIDGTLNEYVSKMEKNGFTLIGTEDGMAILNGDFAGYKGCYIGVSTLKQKDLVHKIAVMFPDNNTWSTLSGNYYDLKKMLTEKYGEPSKVVEEFDTYSKPKDDNSRMYEVGMDRCKYYSIWQTNNGEIQLSIEHESVLKYFVRLGYFDKINSEIIKAEALDDL